MKLYKFVVPDNVRVPDPDRPGFEWSGHLCCVLAETEEAALKKAVTHGIEAGFPIGWLRPEVCRVIAYELNEPRVIAWASV